MSVIPMVAPSPITSSASAAPSSPLPARRKRASPQQRAALLLVFSQTKFPDTNLRNQLAKTLNMTPRSVQVWFQNQRQRTLGGPGASSPPAARSSSSSGKQDSDNEELLEEDEELAKGTSSIASRSSSSSASVSPTASPRVAQPVPIMTKQPVQVYQVMGAMSPQFYQHQQQQQQLQPSLIPSWMPTSLPSPSQMMSVSALLAQLRQDATAAAAPSSSLGLSVEPPKAPSDRSVTSSSPTVSSPPTAYDLPFLKLPPLSSVPAPSQAAAAATSPKKSTSLSFLLNPLPNGPEFRLPPIQQHLDILSSVACGSQH